MASRLKKLINNALKNNTLKRVIADGSAYDNKENFRYLYDNNIEAAIKVRKRLQFSKELQFRRLLLSKKNSCAKTAEEF